MVLGGQLAEYLLGEEVKQGDFIGRPDARAPTGGLCRFSQQTKPGGPTGGLLINRRCFLRIHVASPNQRKIGKGLSVGPAQGLDIPQGNLALQGQLGKTRKRRLSPAGKDESNMLRGPFDK